ncbi:hypothetical protein RFI_05458 [Reticulomyxa filosa]|uniref:Uncharacterized protein n=1 Tax=Reticulomyxa filosa TaxID=46433 RepID=X6P093_RETFI|nr:hypothetical protein RFI_05458 [Reticulomyxa filosa]|eukprot:ETO31661.1 hypothetical protein RFI_05458 [Reticulomyxa filosa]
MCQDFMGGDCRWKNNLFIACFTLSTLLVIPTMILFFHSTKNLIMLRKRHDFAPGIACLSYVTILTFVIDILCLYSTYTICLYDECVGLLSNIVLAYTLSLYLLGKILLYLLLIYRLHHTYERTVYTISNHTFAALFVCIVLAVIAFIGFNINMFSSQTKPDILKGNAPNIIQSTLKKKTSSFFFNFKKKGRKKLTVNSGDLAIYESGNTYNSDIERPKDMRRQPLMSASNEESTTANSLNVRQISLLHVMTRYTILCIVAMVSSITVVALLLVRFSLGWVQGKSKTSIQYFNVMTIIQMVDGIINCATVYMTFKFNEPYYHFFCRRCHNFCISKYLNVISTDIKGSS